MRNRHGEPPLEEARRRPTFRPRYDRSAGLVAPLAWGALALSLTKDSPVGAFAWSIAAAFQASLILPTFRYPLFEVTEDALLWRRLWWRSVIPWSDVRWARSNVVPRHLGVVRRGRERRIPLERLRREDASRLFVLLDRYAGVGDVEQVFA